MPAWLHRTTKAVLESVASADLPEVQANYIEDPDFELVIGQPAKYWVIVGDDILLADAPTRAAIDAQIAADKVLVDRTTAITRSTLSNAEGVHVRELFEVFNKRDNYLVNRLEELQNALLAIKATSGAAATIRDAIPANFSTTNTRPRSDAIQDYEDDINAGGAD